MLWPAVILTALAILGLETLLALKASESLDHLPRYAALVSLVLAIGVVLLVFA